MFLPDDSCAWPHAVHIVTNAALAVLSPANACTAQDVPGGALHKGGKILLQVAGGVNCRWPRSSTP